MKRIFPAVFAVALLALAGVFAYTRLHSTAPLAGTPINAAPLVPPLELTGMDGQTHRLSDYRGKVVLLFFAYTSCPDTCPLTLAALARSYEALGSPQDLQVLMVSVDPTTDTPAVLGRYMARFNRSFVGLTAPAERVGQLASSLYAGFVQKTPSAHDDYVRVLDRQGRFRLVYSQERLARQELHHDLPQILQTF